MKTISVQLCLAVIVIFAGSVSAVTVDVYSDHSQDRGGTPYSGFVGSFYSDDIMFWTDYDNYWFPYDLPDFGAEITGYLLVSETGSYQFDIIYDDGCVVYIDDVEFMYYGDSNVNSGTKWITLAAGIHTLHIEFFEDWGSTSGVDFVPHGVDYGNFQLEKTDGLSEGECVSPQDDLEYAITFTNDSEQTVDVFWTSFRTGLLTR